MPNYARSNLAKTFFGGGKSPQTGVNLFNLITSKKEFFIMIFINLIIQLGITYYVMEKTNIGQKPKTDNQDTKNNIIMLCIIQIGLVIVLGFIPMPSWLKFIIFCVFSAIWGYLLSKVRLKFGEDNVKMALLGTICIFSLMFVFGVGLILSGIKLGYKFELMLFYGLLLLLLFRITQIFISTSSLTNKILVIFSLLLFSIYVVYDTNKILQRNYNGDFITASLDYYLDIINIFTNLLNIDNW